MTHGTWSAPGRVNLIGEHTDYNGGLALPFALPLRTRVRAAARTDGVVVATSAGRHPIRFGTDTTPGDVDGWGAYVAGTAWALREAGHPVTGADLEISSDLPAGAGLSSSAALECAVALAILGLTDTAVDPTELALTCQRAENHYVGAPTGAMDQMACLHGRDGHVVLFDAQRQSADPVPCDLRAAGLTLLVVDTRAPHQHAEGEYGARRRTCHRAAAQLGVESLRAVGPDELPAALDRLASDPEAVRRVRHVVTENQRVVETVELLRRGQLTEVGPLLTRSHASLRDDYEVTVPQLDVAVDAALAAGALGARMTGGGFGGSVIALADEATVPDVESSVRKAFDQQAFAAPSFLSVLPAAGAGRDEHG